MADLEQHRHDGSGHNKLQVKKHCHQQERCAEKKHHRQCASPVGPKFGQIFFDFSMDTPPFFFRVKILYIFYHSTVWRC